MGYQPQQGYQITPQMVAGFVNRSINDFANTYFAHIADMSQRVNAASVAVRNAGYAVGRGQLIYQPQAKSPDVEFRKTKEGKEYLRVKGKLNMDPRSGVGISAMVFPSDYGPGFSVSMLPYGFKSQPNQGMRLNLNKEDINITPDGGLLIGIKFYPDKALLPQVLSWLNTSSNRVVAVPPVGVQSDVSACFGMYDASVPECQVCADAKGCAAKAQGG